MASSGKLKKILVMNRSFWPDSEATGQFIAELCLRLSDKYEITAVAGRSYYIKKDGFRPFSLYKKERLGKINIIRLRHTRFWKGRLLGRLANWFTYALLAFFAALGSKADLIIIATDPPLLGILAMWTKRIKRVPYVYQCNDLYVDVAVELGKLKPNGLIARVFNYLDVSAFNSAYKVVPIGLTMQRRLYAKGVRQENMRVISNWVDADAIKPVPKQENLLLESLGLKDKFIVMYSGNMGLTQDLDIFLEACARCKDLAGMFFILAGQGAMKKELESRAVSLGIKNILFLPYQPMDMLAQSLGMADLHVISFRKGLSGAIVPSKMYGIMAAAKPYLIIGDADSEPALLARQLNCGLTAQAGDIAGITEAIKWCYTHKQELLAIGNNGRRAAEEKFSKDIILGQWLSLLEEFS